MRNIDAKIEGIGFLIAKNEGELENLRIPVGGYVKLQDTGKMLERTADGWKNYEMGGGSSGGGGNTFEKLQGYSNGSAWVQTDEEKALNAELYTKWSAMIANDEYVVTLLKAISNGNTSFGQSIMCFNMGREIFFYFYLGVLVIAVLSYDGSVTIQVGE